MTGLLALCDRSGVRFGYENLDPKVRILGLYFRDREDKPGILLHTELQYRIPLARTVLAEEIGHHVTLGTGTVFVVERGFDTLLSTVKNEKQAIQWAAEYHMPVEALSHAVIKKGYRHPWELAEYFNIVEWLVHRRVYFLREDIYRRWGVRVSHRDLLNPYHAFRFWGDRVEVPKMGFENRGYQTAVTGGF